MVCVKDFSDSDPLSDGCLDLWCGRKALLLDGVLLLLKDLGVEELRVRAWASGDGDPSAPTASLALGLDGVRVWSAEESKESLPYPWIADASLMVSSLDMSATVWGLSDTLQLK